MEKLADAFSQAISNPDVIKRLADLGSTPGTERGGNFRTFIQNDRSKWRLVAKEANLTAK
ncbi:Tripartite tricarboxylate transporter family receptor [compost metagenome]